MMNAGTEVTIPNVRLGLEELLAVIQSLDKPSRARVARALVDAEMDTRLKGMIEEIAERVDTADPADELTDAEIDEEVRAVRRAARPA